MGKLKVVEVTVEPQAAHNLAAAIAPIHQSFRLGKLFRTHEVSPRHQGAVTRSYALSAALLREHLGADFVKQVDHFVTSDADLLVLHGLPWDDCYADFDKKTHAGSPPNEVIYCGLAHMLGASSSYDLRLDYVRDGLDDNLHQDGAYREPGRVGTPYEPTEYLIIGCLNTGNREGVNTLFMDFESVARALPDSVRLVLQKPDFMPKGGNAFAPMLLKEGRGWRLNPAFERCNPFANGLLSTDGMLVRTRAAKSVLDSIAKVAPAPDATSFEMAWQRGTVVVARQKGFYHRRKAPEGVRSEGRLLARARIFRRSEQPNSVATLSGQKLARAVAAYVGEVTCLMEDKGHQHLIDAAKSIIKLWRDTTPQFDRLTPIRHQVAARQPNRKRAVCDA